MADNINQNVAILSLMARLEDNSKEISTQAKKMIGKVEKNAGSIEFGADTKEIQNAIEKINKLIDGKLKGIDLTKQFGSILKVFSNAESSAEDYLNILDKVHNELDSISKLPKNSLNLMSDFSPKQIEQVLKVYDKLLNKQEQYEKKQAEYQKKAQSIEAESLLSLKRRYNAEVSYKNASTDGAIELLSKQIGVENTSAKQDIKQYSQLLSIFNLLQARKKELATMDTAKAAEEEVQINKNLLSIVNEIKTKEKRLASAFGAKDLLSSSLEGFDTGQIEYSILRSTDEYAKKATQVVKDSVVRLQNELDQTILDYSQKNVDRMVASQEKASEKVQARINKRSSSISPTQNGVQDSGIENVSDTVSVATSAVQKLDNALEDLGDDSGSNELDLWTKSAEKLKEGFADVIKYAVDAETAFNRLNEIWKKYDKGLAITQDETTEMWGLMKRLDELELNGLSNNFHLNEDQMDEFREWEDDDSYSKLFNKIQDMTEKQLEEIEKLKVAKKELAEQPITDLTSTVDSEKQIEETTEAVKELIQAEKKVGEESENFTKPTREVLELVQRVETLETSLSDMQKQLNSLNGEAFEKMKNDISDVKKELDDAVTKIKELNANSSASLEEKLSKEGFTVESATATAQYVTDMLALDDKTGVYSEWDNLVETVTAYHEKVKETNAYLQKGNDLIEERAILLKNGKQVGEEYVMSDAAGKVDIGNGIKKYDADSVLHTHAFDEKINNLRFSDADIQELVDGTVKKALLLCGNEIATLDMANVSETDFEPLKNDILGAYTAVFARFGAEVKDGKLVGIDSLPSDVQNQATDIVNNLLRGIMQNYGGDLVFDKIGDGELIANDNTRLPKIDSAEIDMVQKYIGAITSDKPAENIIALQKQFGVLKSGLQETQQEAKDTATALSEVNQTPLSSPTMYEDSDGQLSFVEQTKKTVDLIEEESGQMSMFGNVAEKVTDSVIEGQMEFNDILNKNIDGQMTLNDLTSNDSKNNLLYQYYKQKYPNIPEKDIQNSVDKSKNRIITSITRGNVSMGDGYLGNFIESEDKAIQYAEALNQELQKIGYTLKNSVYKETGEWSAEIVPINENAITDAERMREILFDINQIKRDVNSSENSTKEQTSDIKSETAAIEENTDALKENQQAQEKQSKSKENIPKGWIKDVNKAWDEAINENNKLTGRALLNDYESEFNNLSSKDGKIDEYQNQLGKLKAVIEEIKGLVPIKLHDEKASEKLEELDNKAKELVSDLNNTKKYDLADQMDIDRLSGKISDTLRKNTAAPKELLRQMANLREELKKLGLSKTDIDRITRSFVNLESQMKATGKTGDSLGTKITKKFKDVAAYFATYVSIHDALQVVRQGFETIKEYDTALTEMNKVSEESISTLKEFQKESFGLADSIGTTASALQNSVADWQRLGESLEEAKQSAQDANILFNVSEFKTIDEATESLVSMSQAYKELEKGEIIDVVNNLGNNFAISTDGLATALQNSASALKTAQNDFYESAALTTAANTVVQDPDKVGAGLRTIALRLTGTEAAREELQALGEDVDDFVVTTTSKMDQQIKDLTKTQGNFGVSLLDMNGNYRSTYDVLLDIAKVWDKIAQEDLVTGENRQNALLEMMAGKNRSNILASVLQSPEVLEEAYAYALDSEGSAMRENEAYLESIEAHLAQLKNAWDSLWINENNREVITFFLDLAKSVLEAVNNFGVLNTLLVGGGGIFTAMKAFKGEGRVKKFTLINMPSVA